VYSYDRIQPNTWSGAYLCWGKENREAPLRTACPPGVPLDLVSNFEIKCFDGCANPHLGLAAIVAAGIDGLRRGLKLPEPMGMSFYYCFTAPSAVLLSPLCLSFQFAFVVCRIKPCRLCFQTQKVTTEPAGSCRITLCRQSFARTNWR
jgi:glutamine synthetase